MASSENFQCLDSQCALHGLRALELLHFFLGFGPSGCHGTSQDGTCHLSPRWRWPTRKKVSSLRPVIGKTQGFSLPWALPADLCNKDPCNFNTEIFVSKVGNPCPTLDQLPASRILYTLLVGENITKSPGQDFVHEVAQ